MRTKLTTRCTLYMKKGVKWIINQSRSGSGAFGGAEGAGPLPAPPLPHPESPHLAPIGHPPGPPGAAPPPNIPAIPGALMSAKESNDMLALGMS
ncbi:unnamed protein product [Strongylus vulgaris]|uniref:Uncharacterized protein n=1 Tax=Strongylus vulgaris TaxID=40348 RepID=A0A3P7L844_STRVU|nr:unnamed protein product [Strongylus vulgaris]